MAPMAANAAWNMGEWDQMVEYMSRLDDGDETKLWGLGNTAATGDGNSNGTFFRAVLLFDEAREYVERAHKCLVLESYERVYINMVLVIDYYTLPVENPIAEGRQAYVWVFGREDFRREGKIERILNPHFAPVFNPSKLG
ncbi:hypothetical protein UlMin_028061 [Ulmus minor]